MSTLDCGRQRANHMVLDRFSLTNKIALVTGAGRGLGRGIAETLAQAGADVALVARSQNEIEEVAAYIRGLGRRALCLVADVRHSSQVDEVVREALAELGGIDILCNVAGMNRRKAIVEMTDEDWDTVVDTNLKSVFLVSRAVAPHMIARQRGKIINIASLNSVIAMENMAPYCASKGGVVQLTKAMAVEWARYRINVNAIGPGYFFTDMTATVFANPNRIAQIESRIPFGATGVPEDIAGAAVFLASEASDYMTGQVVYVDGGWLAS
jgi:NAD(P)-dependent dehydrogenase (short-subunit alcohol dehydrogenase family)